MRLHGRARQQVDFYDATGAREHWIHRQDEPSAVRRTAYEFDDLRTGLRGRGLLGFGKGWLAVPSSFGGAIRWIIE